MNKTILAIASLMGTIIGAGVFGIPYVVSRSGVLISFFYFVLLGTAVLLLHLLYGEVVLSTQDRHQLAGYVKKYFGNSAKKSIEVATIVGTVGALLAYVILAGKFLQIILPWGFTQAQYTLFFWAIGSLLVFFGMKQISLVEFLMSGVMLVVFSALSIVCLPKISILNFSTGHLKNIFLPFGVLMFSMVGWHAIPEIMDILGNAKKKLKKVIFVSFFTCLAVYLVFAFSVVGVSGGKTTSEPFEGLANFLGKDIIFLGGVLGFLAVATSFLILANYLKNNLQYDCNLPRTLSVVIAVSSPLALYLLGARDFISVIGIVGVFIGLVEGIAIVLLFKKSRVKGDRAPEYRLNVSNYLLYLIIIILIVGALAEILTKI